MRKPIFLLKCERGGVCVYLFARMRSFPFKRLSFRLFQVRDIAAARLEFALSPFRGECITLENTYISRGSTFAVRSNGESRRGAYTSVVSIIGK